jgi:hypothetical protein
MIPDVVFVFGSNLAGRHGKGAALYAVRYYGAQPGVGLGRQGQAYAIPTKDRDLEPLPLAVIGGYVRTFSSYAATRMDEVFLLTPIGTGLAGYSKRDIALVVRAAGLPSNVVLARTWLVE